MGKLPFFQPRSKLGSGRRHFGFCRFHEMLIRCDGHFRLSDPIARPQGHLMGGSFGISTVIVPQRTAHHEITRGNPGVFECVLRIHPHAVGKRHLDRCLRAGSDDDASRIIHLAPCGDSQRMRSGRNPAEQKLTT